MWVVGPDLRTDPLLAELRAAYEGGNLVAFVGAGVSVAAGLPTFEKLTRGLIKRLRGRDGVEAAVREAEQLAEAGRGALSDHLLELGKRLMQRQEFVEALCAILDDPSTHVDHAVFDRLRGAGVAQASVDGHRIWIRFPLYEAYLRRRWRPAVARGGR